MALNFLLDDYIAASETNLFYPSANAIRQW